jgi:gp6-like head-tail connector protein
MSGIVQQSLPTSEPVLLTDAINFLKINTTADNALIMGLITAARQYVEDQTNLYLASRTFVQFRDSFPQFPFLPSPYAPFVYPWGYPMVNNYPNWTASSSNPVAPADIRLMAWPVTAVDHITYIGLDGEPHNLYPDTDFIVDFISRPARISLLPLASWPQTAITANCVAIYFTAGYNSVQSTVTTVTEPVGSPPDTIAATTFVTGIPAQLWTAILLLVAHWYYNREPVAAGGAVNVPHSIQAIIDLNRIQNFDLLGLA